MYKRHEGVKHPFAVLGKKTNSVGRHVKNPKLHAGDTETKTRPATPSLVKAVKQSSHPFQVPNRCLHRHCNIFIG